MNIIFALADERVTSCGREMSRENSAQGIAQITPHTYCIWCVEHDARFCAPNMACVFEFASAQRAECVCTELILSRTSRTHTHKRTTPELLCCCSRL